MITSKELRYVTAWANKTPMPGIEYSLNVLKNIKECYDIYNEKYKDKEYSMIFSNGEELDFEILSKNLCHMMGIDFKNIKSDYFMDYRRDVFGTSASDMSSYELLELIIENMEKVAEFDNDPNNKAKAINYYKSAIKCGVFSRFSDFKEFNFAAINDDSSNYHCKFLFLPSNESVAPYFLMGIRKNKENITFDELSDENRESEDCDSFDENDVSNGKYYVFSLLAPTNPVEFFDGKEVIIPTQILVSDNDSLTKIFATPDEKIGLLTMYENIVNRYNIANKINIFGDYSVMLNDMSNAKVKTKSIN